MEKKLKHPLSWLIIFLVVPLKIIPLCIIFLISLFVGASFEPLDNDASFIYVLSIIVYSASKRAFGTFLP